MRRRKPRQEIQWCDTVPGTVTVRRIRKNEWRVVQRRFARGHDNNQNVTWLRIENPGRPAKVRVHLIWAQYGWMQLRSVAYLKHRSRYQAVTGTVTPTESVHNFVAPHGESYFGAFPWYTNEDADRFMKRMVRQSPMCEIRSIGTSGEGRDIKCLTISPKSARRSRRNIVVIARTHANESSGSFGVEGTAKYLLSKHVHRSLLRDYVFHLIPVVNPDGVANGTKLTRMGPVEKYDMVRGGTSSDDATIKALREELLRLRPACLISHHSYLPKPPFIGFFEKQAGLAMISQLLPERAQTDSVAWLIRQTGPEPRFLRYDCYKRFNTTVCFTELPWQGRLPKDIEKLGVDVFLATLKAHALKTRTRL